MRKINSSQALVGRLKNKLIQLILLIVLGCGSCYIAAIVILPYICDDRVLARLNARNGREITIFAEGCWEVHRSLSVEVKDHGKIIQPQHFIGVDDGDEHHRYKLLFSEDESIVAVLDTAKKPPELVVGFDFNGGEGWSPYNSDPDLYPLLEKLLQEYTSRTGSN